MSLLQELTTIIEYSWNDWARSWIKENPQAVQKVLPVIRDGYHNKAHSMIMQMNLGSDAIQSASIADEIINILANGQ